MTAKAAAIPTKMVILIDMAIIMARKAGGHSHDDRQKGDLNCAGSQGQSHHVEGMCSCSLAPNLRVTAKVTATFQVATAPVLALCPTTARE
eukprot:9360431-Ditylum_brightwellii.AAC.1